MCVYAVSSWPCWYSYIRAGSSFYCCICIASHTAQWSNYVYYSAEALQRAFRQAGGERPARRNSRQHWKMGSLSSFCCVKGTPRQDEGDCGRLSGFVDSLWLLLPSFFLFFPLFYHLSLTKDFSSEIDLLFTFSFVMDLLCRFHRNLRLLHTHTVHTLSVCRDWLLLLPSGFRSEGEDAIRGKEKKGSKDMRTARRGHEVKVAVRYIEFSLS